jgi:bifunctional non-homologous end joining protein LigD
LDFGQFEGTIPQCECGVGSIKVWDHGTYELEEWTNDRIAFVLHGSRLTGPYLYGPVSNAPGRRIGY